MNLCAHPRVFLRSKWSLQLEQNSIDWFDACWCPGVDVGTSAHRVLSPVSQRRSKTVFPEGHGDVRDHVIRCWYLTALELPFDSLTRAAAGASAVAELVMSDW